MTPRAKAARRRSRRGAGHIRHNRAVWDRVSAWYDHRHGPTLGGRHAASWGEFRHSERQLRLLGPIRGKRVLELGCGAARWSIALAKKGARSVGLDLSAAQLTLARDLVRQAGNRVPLVRGSAERLPFRSASFDTVFCDWGAMTFSDPVRSVPEVARVLCPGGTFVFATASPFRFPTYDVRREGQVRRLLRPYFGARRVVYPGDSAVEFHPPYGVWVDIFRANGLRVERLLETRPKSRQRSTYLSRRDIAWARSWPLETIWKLVKE